MISHSLRWLYSGIFILCAASCAGTEDLPAVEMKQELGAGYSVQMYSQLFYIASNASRDQVQRCASTISMVEKSLERDFVKTKPPTPLRIYLFKDKASYDWYCRKKLLTEPSTPFGFYLWDQRKLVMNIATGTGTLAHELVHPFLEADFPGAQPWFNEGFASLHEQSSYTNDGQLKGLVNWRLPGLQRAIRLRSCPGLAAVMQANEREFYSDNSGIYYAVSRYLCLFLQEKGKLKEYYKQYRDHFSQDISGRKMLATTLGKELPDIENDFRAWVDTLYY